jgi:tRNA-Thr(GGU) m(6)t(6)A37 methyltransferase TsaA
MQESVTLTPVGVIRSPFTSLAGMPIQPGGARDVLGRLELDPALAPALADLEGFSHIYLLYLFHASTGYDLTVTPFLDDTPRGLFATRAPRRPNPIGLSVVGVVSVAGPVVHIRGVDVLDGTPLLDIKPYAPGFDAPGAAVRCGWMEGRDGDVAGLRSDGRFVPKT